MAAYDEIFVEATEKISDYCISIIEKGSYPDRGVEF